MNRTLRNALARLDAAPTVAVAAVLVATASSLTLGTATAHAALIEPGPVAPGPVLPIPNDADLLITRTTRTSVTIENDGALATRGFHVWIAVGHRQGDPLLCTRTTVVPEFALYVHGGVGPYGSVTLPVPWATNTRSVVVDPSSSYLEYVVGPGTPGEVVRERDERNNRGTIPASDNITRSQCHVSP